MAFDIVLAPLAAEDLRALKAHLRAEVRDALEVHLKHEPRKTSRSCIKRLRGLRKPQYRLSVGGYRIFYDVIDQTAEVLGNRSQDRRPRHG